MRLLDGRVVRVGIARPWRQVYALARDIERWPCWAAGLARGVRPDGEDWIADSPMGEVRVRMAPDNPYGVLDHDVTLPDGTFVRNVFRVSPNGEGCDAVFVVHRAGGADEAAFARDAAQVEADLLALGGLAERGRGGD